MTINGNNQKIDIAAANLPPGNIVVYEFGVRLDKDCLSEVMNQIMAARRLYNDLIAEIREVVSAANAYVMDRAPPDVRNLKTGIEALTEQFSAAKVSGDEPEMSRIAGERREKWKILSTALKSVRSEHKAFLQEQFYSRIGKSSSRQTYRLRCAAVDAGLGWGTANAVLDAAMVAFKKSMAFGRAPRFAIGAEINADCLTLQFTSPGGQPAANIIGGQNRELSMDLPGRGIGRRCYAPFRFRLGAAKAGVYATGTWQYHRPIPDSARIGLARLVRRRTGDKFSFAIQLMMTLPSAIVDPVAGANVAAGKRGRLATVHFGWSADVEGRRVAGVAESAEYAAASILQLPPQIESALQRSADIQASRDVERDKIVPRIKQILIADEESEAAREIGRLRSTVAQHISANRLHRTCRLLSAAGPLPEWLESWRKDDRRAWEAATHIARRARCARRDFYREVAIGLGRRFDVIAIEPLDLKGAALKVNKVTGEKNELGRKARSGRCVAAISELTGAIRWAAVKTGTAVLELKGETSRCSVCGGETIASQDDLQVLNCRNCQAILDRKRNGAVSAWRIVNADYENSVAEFWFSRRQILQDREAAKTEKLTKLANGRREARTPSEQKGA